MTIIVKLLAAALILIVAWALSIHLSGRAKRRRYLSPEYVPERQTQWDDVPRD